MLTPPPSAVIGGQDMRQTICRYNLVMHECLHENGVKDVKSRGFRHSKSAERTRKNTEIGAQNEYDEQSKKNKTTTDVHSYNVQKTRFCTPFSRFFRHKVKLIVM